MEQPLREKSYNALPESKPKSYGACFTITFLAIQMILPLRAYAHGQNPSWTEAGQQFSWRMMLKHKTAYIKFLYEPREAEMWIKKHSMYFPKLLDEHKIKLAGQPWMMVQYAREIDRILTAHGMPDIKISVISVVSLNDRAFQVMIDPTVDLTQVSYPIWRTPDWVIPLTSKPYDETLPKTTTAQIDEIEAALIKYSASHSGIITESEILDKFLYELPDIEK